MDKTVMKELDRLKLIGTVSDDGLRATPKRDSTALPSAADESHTWSRDLGAVRAGRAGQGL